MCIEALPDHLKSVDAWKNTDHDTRWMRWFIPVKLKYLCFGPRDTHPWHRWREWPITVFAISKGNEFRTENDRHDYNILNHKPLRWVKSTMAYLSRIQYYTRWHFQVQWPFFIAFHFYFNAKDVPQYGKPRPNTDGKLFYFYFGAHRDADKVYWIPSAYIGTNWK